MVSDAKSTANLIGETFSFSLASLRVSVFHQFDYDMTMCEMFWGVFFKSNLECFDGISSHNLSVPFLPILL